MSKETTKTKKIDASASFLFYADSAEPIMEVKINMVTFMVIMCILIVIALIIGILLLMVLAAGGAFGGIFIFLFGDVILGMAMVVLLIKKICKRK